MMYKNFKFILCGSFLTKFIKLILKSHTQWQVCAKNTILIHKVKKDFGAVVQGKVCGYAPVFSFFFAPR